MQHTKNDDRTTRAALLRRALVPAAVLVLALPGAADAHTASVTVASPGPTIGPGTPFTGVSSHADCAQGLVTGGGADQSTGDNRAGNGNHVMGVVPSADGVTEYTGTPGVVGTDATHWLAFGGSGSNSSPAFATTPYAMCLTSNGIRHTLVVMAKAPGPSVGQTAQLVVATCPAGTELLGGGARSTPASVGSLKPIASYPTFADAAHDFGAKAAADGETDPDSWAAVGGIGGGRDDDNTTYAYAICTGEGVDVRHLATTVRFHEVTGPTAASTSQAVTAGCTDDDGVLVSGGAAASGGNVTTTDFTKAGSGGTHLIGSFPSDAAGTPVADGTTAADWTADIHAGGSPSPNTSSDVWALCLNVRQGPRE
ncbi:hypothetical protein [Streptacidiphilus jiangxiensis]|uniref:Uncharacterized protein n=1 Tax=Streptacidiphilus jiangxiensis TaxID=235985 RepID=A0A1H7KS22_STRJI|nr:hypothetical protein [Streptacidiphilus jiangxiensis]SEK88717.1 hypothetical protein SAMN05414137_104146 [Streptacidiphilus jiangxiensis]